MPTETTPLTDDEILGQPIGYWTWAAALSVRDHIRGALATVDLTQPQWWVLNQLGDPDGVHTRDGLIDLLTGYCDPGDDLLGDLADLGRRGLVLVGDDGSADVTDEGREVLARARAVQEVAQGRIRDGIDDATFVTTMRVLQRLIANTDGRAWHH